MFRACALAILVALTGCAEALGLSDFVVDDDGAGGAGSGGSGGGGAGGSGGAGGVSWALDDWGARMRISLEAQRLMGELSSFPVPLLFDSALLIGGVEPQDDGRDLRVTDAAGAPLATELERYDNDVVLWVTVPELDPAAGQTDIYLYWGNPQAPLDSRSWPGFDGVYHLASAGAQTDSSEPAYNSGAISGTTSEVDGALGMALALDDVTSTVLITQGAGMDAMEYGTSSFSVSLWLQHDPDNIMAACPLFNGGISTGGYSLYIPANSDLPAFYINGFQSTAMASYSTALKDRQWHHLAAVVDRESDTVTLYVDGMHDGSHDLSTIGADIANDSRVLQLGHPSYPYLGGIDELRFAPSIRSPAWIDAEVVTADATFSTLGEVEVRP